MSNNIEQHTDHLNICVCRNPVQSCALFLIRLFFLQISVHFLIVYFVLYILDTGLLANSFTHTVTCLFTFLILYCDEQKFVFEF